jgi:hypothetical protein
MNQTIDNTVEDETKEFLGSNFNYNGYCAAKYRMSSETVTLKTDSVNMEVPRRLEALNTKSEWQQHPVVFKHYGSYENRKQGIYDLVIFLPRGCHTSWFSGCSPFENKRIYEEAERLGLTEGDTMDIKSFPKETD